jgi:hypothetical protein
LKNVGRGLDSDLHSVLHSDLHSVLHSDLHSVLRSGDQAEVDFIDPLICAYESFMRM